VLIHIEIFLEKKSLYKFYKKCFEIFIPHFYEIIFEMSL